MIGTDREIKKMWHKTIINLIVYLLTCVIKDENKNGIPDIFERKTKDETVSEKNVE